MTVQPSPIELRGEALRAVIYGESKVGKTTLAATWPRPLFIDTDGGLISVTYKAGGAVPGSRYEPEGYLDLEDLVRWVREHADEHDTIVIDTADSLLSRLIYELTDERSAHGKRPLLMMQVPEQVEYLANQRQLDRLLFHLRQTGKHVVVLAGVRTDDSRRGPNVSPGAQKILAAWSSLIGELVVLDDGQRALVTEPGPDRIAGSRFSEHLPAVLDPTFDKLWSPVIDRLVKASAPTSPEGQKENQ